MRKLTFYILLILSATSCAQHENNNADMEITSHFKNYKYLTESRPGYYLQVNNQNCFYEIEVNGFNAGKFFGEFPSYSTRIPLNLRILKSGEQKFRLKIYPFKGNTLSDKADIDITVMKYPDMTDLENDFGGSTVLWKWEMPPVGGKNLPYFEMDSLFEADVPFSLEALDLYASDLSKLDKDELIKEVLSEFEQKQKKMVNESEEKAFLLRHIKRSSVQIYATHEEDEELAESMITFAKGKEPQPIENFELRLYCNNKVATLLKRDDKKSAIWFKKSESGARSWQPYYIFKHKETGTWHMW